MNGITYCVKSISRIWDLIHVNKLEEEAFHKTQELAAEFRIVFPVVQPILYDDDEEDSFLVTLAEDTCNIKNT